MDNNNNSGSNFLSGFLLGAIVGGVVVFIFGTKRGKQLLETISQESKENISGILDKASKMEGDLDEESEEEAIISGGEFKGKEENPIEMVKPKIRRFFRGISKRVN